MVPVAEIQQPIEWCPPDMQQPFTWWPGHELWGQGQWNILATTSETVPFNKYDEGIFRSASALEMSDQNRYWVQFGRPMIQILFMQTTKTDQTARIRRLI